MAGEFDAKDNKGNLLVKQAVEETAGVGLLTLSLVQAVEVSIPTLEGMGNWMWQSRLNAEVTQEGQVTQHNAG